MKVVVRLPPLAESVPPKLYGGTERVVAWLVDELVDFGHEVTLFASGDSWTKGKLHSVWPRALRLGRRGADPSAACSLSLEAIAKCALISTSSTPMSTGSRSRCSAG